MELRILEIVQGDPLSDRREAIETAGLSDRVASAEHGDTDEFEGPVER